MKSFWIIKGSHAYKGYANIYSVKILHFFDTEPQHKDYESAIHKFETTLVLEFKKMGNVDKTIYNTLYSNSKIETINKESDIDDVFESVYSTVRSNMQKSLGKGSNGITGLVIDHDINILTSWYS